MASLVACARSHFPAPLVERAAVVRICDAEILGESCDLGSEKLDGTRLMVFKKRFCLPKVRCKLPLEEMDIGDHILGIFCSC